jgi:pimeloyl-ACP methyl ester carboxylesterase
MRVLLIHGLGRTPMSMVALARRLRLAGHATESLGYVAALEPFDRIKVRVRTRLMAAAGRREPYAVIGHSLGGLLARAALRDWPATRPLPVALITVGSPVTPPRLACRFKYQWWFPQGAGDCGQRLAEPLFFDRLSLPPVPWLQIAGTAGWRGRRSPFGNELNDGVVALDEATLDVGAATLLTIDGWHTFLMNKQRAWHGIDRVLSRLD